MRIKLTFYITLIFLSVLGQKENKIQEELQMILTKTVDQNKVFGTSFAIQKDSITWIGAAGNIDINQSYFIASTTKLFTSAIVFYLFEQNKLNLEDKISKYLDNKVLKNLHVYKGKEYTQDITIKHLLSHTSGLPDYFQDKDKNGESLEKKIVQGKDTKWSFEEAIEISKKLKPLFIPGAKNKAHYSDVNFQILGKIIEVITKKSYVENCNEIIINPLQLKHTCLFPANENNIPIDLYYKNKTLQIPKAMESFGADGGIVSNSVDMLIFIRAFFTGKIFPEKYIIEMQKWNKIFFPMQSGIGIHLFKLPWFFNPTGAVPNFIGHSGLSGALAFYVPQENIFIVGTVNQIAYPDISFKTMIKLTLKFMKAIKN
jgi:D-alanyl-D-alanine carboxypeptidase